MPDERPLIGRKEAVQAVGAVADRPLVNGRRTSVLRPVLVVEGARGTGKSAVLQHIGELLDPVAPYARIDLGDDSAADVPQVLSAVAFALGRYVPRYDVISFPRLAIARQVMQQTLDLKDRTRAKAQLTHVIAAERGLNTLRAGLGRAAGAAVNVVQGHLNLPGELADVIRDAADEGARGAWSWGIGRRKIRIVALGKAFAWFGHRDRHLPHDPLDKLVDLNLWALNPTTADHRSAIDELVWDAFLTDLRQHFRDADSNDWPLNCILLIDNADTAMGREFITSLVHNRGLRQDDPDPLAVVVASTGAVLAARDPQDVAENDAQAAGAGWRRFRRLRLSDLSEDDVVNLIANVGLQNGNPPRLPIMIHQLTEGHPDATQLMITTIAQHETLRDDPVKLLAQPEPERATDRLSVADRLRAKLLGEFPRDSFDDLVTCSAALDVEHRRALSGLTTGTDGELTRIDETLWSPVGGAGPRVLRRLLHPLLADRDDTHPAWWGTVFEHLRTGRAAAGDERGELYYALAVGDLAHVVVELEKRLSQLDCEQWRDLLLAVTAAPRRRPATAADDPSPDQQFRDLLRRSAPASAPHELTQLVAGLWIANDPTTDARRRNLHLQIAFDYQWLAGHSPQDSVQCYRQSAQWHTQHAAIWPWN